MKHIITFSLLVFLIAQPAAAFCSWGFVPQGREYEPLNATEAFISYENGTQKIVLQPEWQGNAQEFGIVYPTPSKPDVTEAPANLFNELNEATNPWVQKGGVIQPPMMEASSASGKTVTVVEEKQVAEYKVTVLTATNAKDLVTWLSKNGYNYAKTDADKVDYYVQKGGFYFVALKVDATHVTPYPRPMLKDGDVAVSSDSASKIAMPIDWYWGQLSPIQIAFSTDKPQLPMRTLKSAMPEMTFDLYMLSSKALFIPGVDTVWSNLVDSTFLKQVPSIQSYNPKAKWLVRQEVKFNPSLSDEDVYLSQVTVPTFTTVQAGKQVRFNPSDLNAKTGIIPGVRGQVIFTNGSGKAYTFTRSLTVGSVGVDVQMLQKLLNEEGFLVADSGPGSKGNESTYFGIKTKDALARYQNFYRDQILKPAGLTSGTGYFGPATIKFIN